MSTRTITRYNSSTTQTLPKKEKSLVLRLKQPRKRAVKKISLFSWKGLEEKREKLKKKAHEYNDKLKHLEVLTKENGWYEKGWSANALVTAGFRDLSSVAAYPYVCSIISLFK